MRTKEMPRGPANRNPPALPAMTEEEKRRKALEIQARLFPGQAVCAAGADADVTRAGQAGAGAVTVSRAEKVPPVSVRTKPDKRENEFMLNLMVLRNTLVRNAPACRDRARRAGKWIWRDIRLMLRLVCKIQEAMLATMPESRDDYYRAYAQHGHYELHIDGPVRVPRYLLVKDKHLAAMAEAAMKSECILCMREGSEIGQCQIREALMEAAPPTEMQEGLWRKCEYRDAAGALIQGKDVTV